jgi:voltage-gated potassium channel
MNSPRLLQRIKTALLTPIRRFITLAGSLIWETLALFVRNAQFRLVFSLMMVIAFMGAVVVTFAERSGENPLITNIPDAVWWAFVTLTTTGYGDFFPKTTFGRFVAVAMMFAGLALISLFTATVASLFVTRELKEARGLERVRWQGHTLICGWNNHAEKVLSGLIQAGRDRVVLVSELSEEQMAPLLESYGEKVKYVRGNYCQETILDRANVRTATAAIILADTVSGTAINADERTILATLAIKSIEPHVITCAELLNRDNEQHLRRADVDDVIISGEANGLLLASSIASRGVPQVVRELLSLDVGSSFYRAAIPARFVGRPCRELAEHLRITHHAILVAIVTDDSKIEVDDILGSDNSSIDEFIRKKFAEADRDVFGEVKHKLNARVNPPDDYQIQPQDGAIVIADKPVPEK